jgi:N-acylneuraminate cytidylyltransferase
MGVIAIIPARGESKRLPRKNIIDFCGKPLIVWSILQSLESTFVEEVYVSSDSEEILDVAEKNGALGIKRPTELAADTSTSESALLHALDQVEKSPGNKAELVVFLQATSPLREVADIDGAVRKLRDDGADSLFSSSKLEDFFIWEQRPEGLNSLNFDFKKRARRQDVKPQYVENGSIYVFKTEILRKYNNRLGGNITTYEMEFWKTWEIDSMDDKELCEWYMEHYLLKKPHLLRREEIDLIVYDFDGVFTDNRVLVRQDGMESVLVNRADGLGINMIKNLEIPQLILSTETNPVVEVRAKKVGLPILHNSQDKLKTLRTYCHKHGHDLTRVLYVGHDINDLGVMKVVGYPLCPSDAYDEIKKISKFVLSVSGGAGVVRELTKYIEVKNCRKDLAT